MPAFLKYVCLIFRVLLILQILYKGKHALMESGLQREDYVRRLRERLWMQHSESGKEWEAEHFDQWKRKAMDPDRDVIDRFVDRSSFLPLHTYVWDWFGPDQTMKLVLCDVRIVVSVTLL